MTNRQHLALSFFLSRALFLGGGLANIISLSKQDCWISAIFGILIGIMFIYLIHYSTNNMNITLHDYLKDKKIISITIKYLLLITSCFIILICLLAITSLLDNYYLPLTPPLVLSISFIIICIFSIHKGHTAFIRVVETLFPLCLLIVIIKTLMLTNSMHLNYFLPILTVNTKNILFASLNYSTITAIPFLLIIDEKISLKNKIIHYLIGTFSTLLIIISVTAVLGYPLMETLSFPEYAILRKIEFLDFIENIENIIAIIWFIDLYVLLTTSSFCIKKIFNKKTSYILIIIITIVFNLFIIKNYNIVILIYNYYIYILFILLILIIVLLALKKKLIASKST